MERRNKRDAKFLIFQSLYIIAISILFYKGTDLSLNKVTEVSDKDTVISKTNIPLPPDTSKIEITKIEYDSLIKNNTFVSKDETVVENTYLNKLKAGQKVSTPNVQSTPKKPGDDGKEKVVIPGERDK